MIDRAWEGRVEELGRVPQSNVDLVVEGIRSAAFDLDIFVFILSYTVEKEVTESITSWNLNPSSKKSTRSRG